MSGDPNIGFVIAAYALGLMVVAGMILTILLDYKSLKKALARLPQRRAQGQD
jgi:heme exporter protein D